MKEHSNNIKLDTFKHSVITEHILKFSHKFDWDNIKIPLQKAITTKDWFQKCCTYIKEQTNGINAQKDTEMLDSAYFDILDQLSRL